MVAESLGTKWKNKAGIDRQPEKGWKTNSQGPFLPTNHPVHPHKQEFTDKRWAWNTP